jgi:hypothetical protein
VTDIASRKSAEDLIDWLSTIGVVDIPPQIPLTQDGLAELLRKIILDHSATFSPDFSREDAIQELAAGMERHFSRPRRPNENRVRIFSFQKGRYEILNKYLN